MEDGPSSLIPEGDSSLPKLTSPWFREHRDGVGRDNVPAVTLVFFFFFCIYHLDRAICIWIEPALKFPVYVPPVINKEVSEQWLGCRSRSPHLLRGTFVPGLTGLGWSISCAPKASIPFPLAVFHLTWDQCFLWEGQDQHFVRCKYRINHLSSLLIFFVFTPGRSNFHPCSSPSLALSKLLISFSTFSLGEK